MHSRLLALMATALLAAVALPACGSGSDGPRTVIAIPAEQQAQQKVEDAAADVSECFEKVSTDTRVQSDDCFHLTKDDDTSWEDRIHEFGDCVASGRARKDCY
jgi:hypothetical protein